MKRIIFTCMSLSLCLTINAQSWWAQTSPTSENLMSVNAYNDFNVMVFGDTLSTMGKTTNQGFTWNGLSPIYTSGDLVSSASLTSGMHVAVGVHDVPGGNGVVMKTVDGGSTWSVDSLIPEKLFDVSFSSPANGWISGENGYIARSSDGGSNWTALTTGTGEDLFSVHFSSDTHGWAVGSVTTDAVILRTTNGGTNWTEQASGIVEDLFSVYFVDEAKGWAVGAAGEILATTDSGNVWTSQTSGTGEDLFDVHFIDDTIGWVVGGGGTVLKTTDGGSNWTSEASGTAQDIQSISMRSATLGWFCGDGGIIHVYGMSPPNSIEENRQARFNVYPNPASESLTIQSESNSARWQFELLDLTGKTLLKQNVEDNNYLLNVNDFKSGTYFLRVIESSGAECTQKVVIK